jgi:hypothetical protein
LFEEEERYSLRPGRLADSSAEDSTSVSELTYKDAIKRRRGLYSFFCIDAKRLNRLAYDKDLSVLFSFPTTALMQYRETCISLVSAGIALS